MPFLERDIHQELLRWKASSRRKPLVLRGARQAGKTSILQYFAEHAYDDYIYLNFEEKPELSQLFEENLNPQRILKDLQIYFKKPILPGTTLIIFDEIQECPNALNSLKYFCEKSNEYHIASAGSLLGVKLSKGFPVGKVNFLNLAPMSFFEFLKSVGEIELTKMLTDLQDPKAINPIFHDKLIKLLKAYFIVGGMPEAIITYLQDPQDFHAVRVVQKDILDAYTLDFAKHAPKEDLMKIMQVWNLIPSQLSKENKKFIFTAISKSTRAREYESAIQWLVDAGLIIKIYHTSNPKLPLEVYATKNIFKIFGLDVGLLGAMSKLAPEIVLEGNKLFEEFKGALTENYVAQELSLQNDGLYYWTSAGIAEVDFLLSSAHYIFPLEVKAGISTKKRSLLEYGKKYLADEYHTRCLSRTTLLNFARDGNLINYPLYAIALFPHFEVRR